MKACSPGLLTLAAFFLFSSTTLSACGLTAPNSIVGQEAVGKRRLEAALAKSDIITFKNGNNSYFVLSGVEVFDTQFCGMNLNSKLFNGEWRDGDGPPRRQCSSTASVLRAWPRDLSER